MSDFSFLAQKIDELNSRLGNETKERLELHDVVREQGHAIRNATMILERLVNILEPSQAKSVDSESEN